jgi:hypothetical protein
VKVNKKQIAEVSPDDFLDFKDMSEAVELIGDALHKYEE